MSEHATNVEPTPIPESPSRRRWWPRLHFSTYVVGLLTVFVFLLLNWPGEPNRKPDGYYLDHGWPFTFVTRHGFVANDPFGGGPWGPQDVGEAWIAYFAIAKNVESFHALALLGNTVLALVAIGLIMAGWEWRCRRRQRPWWQFTLWRVFVMVTLCAVILGSWAVQRDRDVLIEQVNARHLKHSYREPIKLVPSFPAWLRALCGDEFLQYLHCNRVQSVSGLDFDDESSADACLRRVKDLVPKVALHCDLTERLAVRLNECSSLDTVHLDQLRNPAVLRLLNNPAVVRLFVFGTEPEHNVADLPPLSWNDLAGLSNLGSLEANRCHLDFSGKPNSPRKLWKLHLKECVLDHGGLDAILAEDCVDWLSIERIGGTQLGLRNLAKHLHRDLTYLTIVSDELTDEILRDLPELPNLKAMWLESRHAHVAAIPWENLSKKAIFRLRRLRFTQADLEALAQRYRIVYDPIGCRIAGQWSDPAADDVDNGPPATGIIKNAPAGERHIRYEYYGKPENRSPQGDLIRRLLAPSEHDLLEPQAADERYAFLAQEQQLDELDLAAAPIGDHGLTYVAKMPALRTLDMTQTFVTTAGLAALSRCPK